MSFTSRIAAAAARGYGMFTAVSRVVDPYFNQTVLLLPGNGTNGQTNGAFVDSSPSPYTLSTTGNVTQGTFTPFSQTGWGASFNGVSDYLSVSDNAAWNMGSGNFTAEAWILPTSFANEPMIMGQWSGSTGGTTLNWALMMDAASAGSLRLITSSTGSAVLFDLSAASALALNRWQHICAVRNGNVFTIYVNGTALATTTNSASLFDATNTFTIGARSGGAAFYQGYISNLRVVKGTAVYTTNFTPSTTPLTALSGTSLLTCQSNRFVDNSSNAFAITRNGTATNVQAFSPFAPTASYSTTTVGGSGYFDGTSDQIFTAATQIIPSSTTYTVEAYVYLNTDYSATRVIAYQGTAAGVNRFQFGTAITNGNFTVTINGVALSSGTPVPRFSWQHLAFVNNANSYAMYVNGVSVATGTNALNPENGPIYIGTNSAGSLAWLGYISNFRVSNTARYTSGFTPPTAPFTSDANTSMLLSCTNAGIIDVCSRNGSFETVAQAQISTAQSKFGGSSMLFDGTTDRVANTSTSSSNPNYAFNTGDFTIEGWFYMSSAGTRGLFQTSTTAGGISSTFTTGAAMFLNASLYLGCAVGAISIVGSTASPTNSWNHFALTRYNGQVRLFLNGVQQGSTTADSTNLTGTYLCVGGYSSTSLTWSGYIDDFRITTGIARYTSNFTPPTSAFPLQ